MKPKNIQCQMLKILLDEESEMIAIEHWADDKHKLSECYFDLEEAYIHAQQIISVYDEAIGVV